MTRAAIHFFTVAGETETSPSELQASLERRLRSAGALQEGDVVIVTQSTVYAGTAYYTPALEVVVKATAPSIPRALSNQLTQVAGMARGDFSDDALEGYIRDQAKEDWDTLASEARRYRPDFPIIRPEANS